MGAPSREHDGHEHRHVHGDGEAAHAHPYAHADAEGGWEPSRPGSVMLDIGPGAGALVVLLPEEVLGEEIEARPADRPVVEPLVHTAVRERLLPGGSVYAAVFQTLEPGRYLLEVRQADGGRGRSIGPATVSAGIVAELDLR